MASPNNLFRASRVSGMPGTMSIRATLRSWAVELAPFPNRWRRAARAGFVTAIGAGVMAAMQIANPLGLTLLVNFALPEFAFSLGTGIAFLVAAAAIQLLMLVAVGALVDSPVVHVCTFIAFAAVSTYLIYGVPKLGRLWLWIQIPAVTAFYLVLFDQRALGWDSAQMFAGTAIAIALLWLFNSVFWPEPAGSVLADSLRNTFVRARRRLGLLIAIFLGDAARDDDRGVASKLAYHLALFHPATRKAKNLREPAELLATVMVAERIDNELDRLCLAACSQAGATYDDGERRDLLETAAALESAIEQYDIGIDRPAQAEGAKHAESLEVFHARISRLHRSSGVIGDAGSAGEVVRHLVEIGELLTVPDAELPRAMSGEAVGPVTNRAFPLNRFLVRFCVRHTVAMTFAFVAGLFDHSAALHAALWLLMIGGPPSHGATAKKFTVRAIGASGALIFAALATIVLAPNFTSVPPYMAAIFIGVMLITYVGEGGGQLSFLAIGATAFVIAFSGPGPRSDLVGSIWTIWGISLGMIIRAVVSIVSIELPNRTLAEEVERPLKALLALAPSGGQVREEVTAAEMELIGGIEAMLSVAADTQLEGRSAGIDAKNLVDALDTMRRLGFALGNLPRHQPAVAVNLSEGANSAADVGGRTEDQARLAGDTFERAIRLRLDSWLASIRDQIEPGRLTVAPLRTMVSSTTSPDLMAPLEPLKLSGSAIDLATREHLSGLIRRLEHQLMNVSLS
jgi:hypothetical protein